MKNLEAEYKNSINEEMPDLWGRIEASLPAKKVRRFPINRYASVAAAAVFLALVIPGSIYLMNQTDNAKGMNFAADSVSPMEKGYMAETAKYDQAENAAAAEMPMDGAAEEVWDAENAFDTDMAVNGYKNDLSEKVSEECEAAEGTAGAKTNNVTKDMTQEDGVIEENFTILERFHVDGEFIFTLFNVRHTYTAYLSASAYQELRDEGIYLNVDDNYLFSLVESDSEDFTYRIIRVK